MECDTLTDIKLSKTVMSCRSGKDELTLRLVNPQ